MKASIDPHAPATACIAQVGFRLQPKVAIEVTADAPRASSDGGLLLLRQADETLGLCERWAKEIPDDREATRVAHKRLEQVRQRVFQIAMGYEDCSDADHLRDDPVLKTTCDRLPNDQALSAQPTLSRFENAVDARAIEALINDLEQSYVDELPADTSLVVLDIDGTDDETHGNQQLTFFHGFYDHYMYHPLLVFDGDTGQLISAILRPGNAHAARGARPAMRARTEALRGAVSCNRAARPQRLAGRRRAALAPPAAAPASLCWGSHFGAST